MLIKPRYKYEELSRTEGAYGRQYLCPDGSKVASVTTILDKTKSEEKKQVLQEWRKRVGEENATQIVKEAAGRGTSMHKQIEKWVQGEDFIPGSNVVHQQAQKMASIIIDQYIKPNVNEVWGNEVSLYFPELYAGTTDCVGLWDGKPAIIDFKQTNKPKKREWIEDYFLQLTAYAEAHNAIYGTNINCGVILMCSKDLEPQHWVLEGKDFEDYKDLWWDRVEKYYKHR